MNKGGRAAAAFLAALLLAAGCGKDAAPPAEGAQDPSAPVAAIATPEPNRIASPGAKTPTPTVGISASERLAGMEATYGLPGYDEAALTEQERLARERQNAARNLSTGSFERRQGDADAAMEALEAAYRGDPSNMEAMLELCGLYVETGRLESARRVANEAWEDGAGAAEAGMLLSTIAIMEGRYEDAAKLTETGKVQNLLKRNANAAPIYMGQYDGEGRPNGDGTGVYSHVDDEGKAHMSVYMGQYEGGRRAGLGRWASAEFSQTSGRYTYDVFQGEWANDAPNGYGEITCHNYQPDVGSKSFVGTVKRSGNYVNGLEDGAMAVESMIGGQSGRLHTCPYNASMGLRATTGQTYTYADGSVGHLYAKCNECSGWTIMEDTLQSQWGIAPWGDS